MASAPEPAAAACAECGTELAPGLAACPGCHRLVHAEELQRLAGEAETATRDGDRSLALAAWRRALDLLPPGSRQHGTVAARVATLSREVDGGRPRPTPGPATGAPPWRFLASLGALGLLLWKFKFVLGFVVTKGKLLLTGLTQTSTLLSMLLSLGVYWSAWGWAFALGLLLSLYVHEMGHVVALQRFGIAASAPMFVPGLGAFVRMKQYPTDAREDARVGLAGPIWGLGAALAAYAASLATGAAILAAIARVGAWINLFNLLPVWQLDGGRGFRALTRRQRWVAAAATAAAWFVTAESLLVILSLAAAARALLESGSREADRTALVQYVGLVAVLAALTTIPVRLSR